MDTGVKSTARPHDKSAEQAQTILGPITRQINSLVNLDVAQAADAAAAAQAAYHSSRTQMLVTGLIAILLGSAVFGFLVRAIVPRVRR